MRKGFYALHLNPTERVELEYHLSNSLTDSFKKLQKKPNKVEERGVKMVKKVFHRLIDLREKRRKR